MALDALLLDILVCPIDKEPLWYLESEGTLYNPRTKTVYRINDDIPVLLPNEGTLVDDKEAKRLAELESTAVVTGSGHASS